MSLHEFELIERYFKNPARNHDSDVVLGIGDDCALISPPDPTDLFAMTVDTLVADVHFNSDVPPHAIGYKSLAVNLSDLAAMGATPRYALLALTLPKFDEDWLSEFSRGFFELLHQHQMTLIGGDITRGPLSITIQVTGSVPKAQALTRAKAQVGDAVYVTGSLGDAAAALLPASQQEPLFTQRLQYPSPRIDWGVVLREHAHAAIDISDGLLADLGHICIQSDVGACINVSALPLSTTLQSLLTPTDAINLALSGGDDYELCFTIAPEHAAWLQQTAQTLNCPVHYIGDIVAGNHIQCVTKTGADYPLPSKMGYQHF